jgi:dTDP-4-amino-4,6-dideoxygalactose transaminase
LNNLAEMKRIPFYSLDYQHEQIRKEMDEAFARVVNKSWFILGDELSAFERELASYQKEEYCVGVGNGFDAIFLSLIALGIGMGDEVIVPAHTYIATWLAVSRTGATPVPVDVHLHTWLMDVGLIERSITSRTKAILPVHLYGLPCDMEAIGKIARKHGLKIVEDNAQSCGTSVDGKKTGSWGDCNAFSFYPTKNLGALGDGGAIVTNDKGIYENILAYRNYGQKKKYETELQGVNSRLDELQAAVLRIKLSFLNKWNDDRKEIAKKYLNELDGTGDLKFPHLVSNADPGYHIFPVFTSYRNQLQEFLKDHSIETLIHYPFLPYQQKAYEELKIKEGAFPVAESIAKHQLSLPIWPGMAIRQIIQVCDQIKAFYRTL